MDTLTYWNGTWHEGNPAILGPRDHAYWLGSMVFDGGRAFEGCGPDLDLHAERVVRSARALGLKPTKTAKEILELLQTVSLLGVSLPPFLLGILLILVFAVMLHWLPSFGRGQTVQIGWWTTNFLTISMFKSGTNDPASPCVAPGLTITGHAADCAGATCCRHTRFLPPV